MLLSLLRVEHIRGTRQWITTDWFRFRSAVVGRTVTVPPGFVTDFNSTPRALWRIMPPDDNPEQAVVHDYLYARNGCTRLQADRIHREIAEVLNAANVNAGKPECAPRWKREAMYLGLRIGGWRAWGRYRRQQKATNGYY